MPNGIFSGNVICDFNGANFASLLNNSDSSPRMQVSTPDVKLLVPYLRETNHSNVDFSVVWSQPGGVIPSFQDLLAGNMPNSARLVEEVDEYCDAIRQYSRHARFLFVPLWTLPNYLTGDIHSISSENGGMRWLYELNHRMIKSLSTEPNIYLLPADEWVKSAGINAFSPNLWYRTKIPFSQNVFLSAVAHVKSSLRQLTNQPRKLIVVDLDDTLWGGIVGDDCWQNLRIGGHDPEGEAFQDFQYHLRALKRRGILLAIASKNNESIALEAIDKHPEMLLRRSDFVGWKINWNDKASNIRDLVRELNLGLQSVVFIDDNPMERARVRDELPEVLVPDWPQNKMNYTAALMALNCFNDKAVTEEDRRRTEMYRLERERTNAREGSNSIDDWLTSIDVIVEFAPLDRVNLSRATQLLNKTNQMNLTTRRMTEPQFWAWSDKPENEVWVVRVSDKFGDSGLTGILSISNLNNGKKSEIVDFVLSCRVFGRRAEDAMLYFITTRLKTRQSHLLSAKYIETPKNAPTLDFFKRSGMESHTINEFIWRADALAAPKGINIRGLEAPTESVRDLTL